MHGGRFACAAVLVALVGGGAAHRADLVESSVIVTQHGRSLTVTDVVRNRGTELAPASTTGYFIANVQIGARRVGRLAPAQSSRSTTTLAIPGTVKPGSRRLRACADVRFRVRESNERNNCRIAPAVVHVGDVTPPSFAGLVAATTCIPGPVGGRTRSSAYGLKWNPATDNITPQGEIVYEVYAATAQGTEDFGHPTYVSDPGATTYVTPLLQDDVPHYFVVRARDSSGNRDGNTVERPGRNLCLAMAASLLASRTRPTHRVDQVVQFSTPSKNIGCVYARFAATPTSSALPATLRCDIRTGLVPKPAKPRGCSLDWGDSFELRKTGRVDVTCHGDTALGSDHILAYGKVWRHDGFTCTSRRAGLMCKNLSGHGFFLSRRSSRRF